MNIIMNLLKVFLIIFMLFATIIGATALEIDDNEDIFILSPGDLVKGAFVVDEEVEIDSDFPWIIINKEPNYLGDGATSYIYEISVPKDTDIGVYRAIISISGESELKYLNIKISVQNKPFSVVMNSFREPSTSRVIYITLIFIVIIFLIVQYMRYLNDSN